MPLWGITDESKPKWLTDAQKKEVYANESGWVVEGGSTMTGNDNANAQPEILACIGDLDNRLSNATITEVELPTSYSDGTGGNFDVLIRFNEAVTVTGNPTILITNQTASARNFTAAYVSGSTSNEITFRKTSANATVNAADVLKIVAASPFITLAGGTIKDLGTNTASDLNVGAAIATASGSLTVAA